MCMAGHITLDAAQDLRGSHDHALEAPWDLSDFFIQWPEKLQLSVKSSISMKKCGPPEIDKSLERPQKSFMSSVQFSRSVVSNSLDPRTVAYQSSLVHHQLIEFIQTHVHWVTDAIQPCHPLLSLSPPALSLSQHQGLFKWVSSSHQVAKVLEFQLQHQPFHWLFRTDVL